MTTVEPRPLSIGGRAALATSGVLFAALSIVAIAIDSQVESAAGESLDDRLRTQAEMLAAHVHFDGHTVELESDAETTRDFERAGSGAYFQVATANGVVGASRSLIDLRLPLPESEKFVPFDVPHARRIDASWIQGVFEPTLRLFTLVVQRPMTGSGETPRRKTPRATVAIQVARAPVDIDEAKRDTRSSLAVTLSLALVFGTLGVFLAVRRATVSIRRLSREACEVGDNSLARRLEVGALDGELRALAIAINAAFDRLTADLVRQSRFAAEAAHELRTPIAILRARLELTLRRPREPGACEDALRAALKMSHRLEQIVEDLMMLTRAGDQLAKREAMDLCEVVRRGVGAAQIDSSGTRVRLHLPEACAFIGGAVLLERMVANLVDNAIRHGSGPAAAEIDVSLEADERMVRLRVSDRGPGFPKENLAHGFVPLRRDSESRGRSSGGTGLGLAIVHAIARAHAGTVDAREREGGGAEVVVEMPIPHEAA